MKRVCSMLLVVGLALGFPMADAAASSPDDGWKTASPEMVGIDSGLLDRASDYARSLPDHSLHSLLVVRDGVLAYERYFTGPNNVSGQAPQSIAYSADTPHEVFSVTKTVVALLVGIARDRGLITSLDAPAMECLPAYADLSTPELKRITLRHLLTMSSGLAWNEKLPFSDPANTMAAALNSGDPNRYLLSRPIDAEPGRTWLYNSIAPNLLVAALRNRTGLPTDTFAQEALFEPLGIPSPAWARQPNGDPVGGFGLALRPRDMAKIGQMMLAGGVWRGRRIVSREWLADMTKPSFPAENRGYGFMTWLDHADVEGRTIRWSAAHGYGGQRIVVVPSLDLVVVVTTGNYATDPQETLPHTLLARFILPAAVKGGN